MTTTQAPPRTTGFTLPWPAPRRTVSPVPRDPKQVAKELHTLLAASGEPGPYVLVGHSIGGLFVRVYAARYPSEVARLVLVDPESDSLESSSEMPIHLALRGLQRIGVLRVFGPALAGPRGMSDYAPYLPALISNHSFDRAIDELRADAATRAESRAITTFGDTPVIVLCATASGASQETAAVIHSDHLRYAAQSSQGNVLEVDTSHYPYREQPDAVMHVIESLLSRNEQNATI